MRRALLEPRLAYSCRATRCDSALDKNPSVCYAQRASGLKRSNAEGESVMRTQKTIVGTCLLAGMLLCVGCATVPAPSLHMAMDPVMPRPGEVISPYLVVVLADASGSMAAGAFDVEKSAVQSFVDAMPCGEYGAAVRSFGGPDRGAWQWPRADWFGRKQHAAQAESLELIGGITTLPGALNRLQGDVAGRQRHDAIVIFSDGRVKETEEAVAAVGALVRSHRGKVCVYTVQIGDDSHGKEVLEAIARTSGCGAYCSVGDISTVADMEAFVRRVFFVSASAMDSDGDGVCDDKDECPDTPKGAKVDARGCWVIVGLNFDSDKSDIKPELEGRLDEVAAVLEANPSVRVRIDGHTDSRASEAYNQALSLRRAEAVRAALEARGVGGSVAGVFGAGETQPAVPNDSAANRYINRRVELTVVD